MSYESSLQTVRDLSGSEHTRHVAKLLDEMVERYRNELESAPIERVQALQNNIGQCRALARVIRGESHADPMC